MLAHVSKLGLGFLGARGKGANLLLGSVCNAHTALHGNVLASLKATLFACWAMGRTHAGLLDILGTTGMLALLALGSVLETHTSLHHRIGALGDLALAGLALGFRLGGSRRLLWWPLNVRGSIESHLQRLGWDEGRTERWNYRSSWGMLRCETHPLGARHSLLDW